MDSRISRAVLLTAGFGLGCPQSSDDGADPLAEGASTDGTGGGGDATGGDDDDDDDDDDDADDDSSGGEPSPTGPFVEGDRIKVVVSRSPEGLQAFEGWWDSELEQYCFWGDVGAGEMRCLPRVFASNNIFADADCGEPAILEGCSVPDVVSRSVEPFCSGTQTQYSVWDVGDAVDALYVRNSNDECTAWDGSGGYRLSPRSVDAYERGEVDRAEFGGLARNELTGDDGTRMWAGPYTTETDEFCEIRDVDGTDRCVSYNRAFELPNIHTDIGCTNADVLTSVSDRSCDPPGLGVLNNGEVVGVGESLEGQAVYSGDPETCNEVTNQFSFPLFRAAPIDASALPLAQIVLEGEGRLQLRAPATVDGDVLGIVTPAWYDSDLGFACVAQSVGDSTICRPPQSVADGDFFADAGCEEPLLRQGNLLPGWYSRFEDGDTCEPSTFLEAVRIGDPYDGAAWRLTDVGCESLEDPESYGPMFAFEERVGRSGLATLEF